MIPALDVDTIYDVPIAYHAEGMDGEVLRHFGLPSKLRPTYRAGSGSSSRADAEGDVRIAIVGKYTNLLDSYKSLAEALTHGGIANRVKVSLDWVDSEISNNPIPSTAWKVCMVFLFRAASANAARPARSTLSASPANTRCRSSASVSACRWR